MYNTRTNNNQPATIVDAYVRLGYAIVEQAVDDISLLRKNGLIQDGRCVEKWPESRTHNRVRIANEYDGKQKVNALAEWVKSSQCAELLEAIEAPIQQEVIIDHLEGKTQLRHQKPSYHRTV